MKFGNQTPKPSLIYAHCKTANLATVIKHQLTRMAPGQFGLTYQHTAQVLVTG
jgi:hypothetical protein